jgi:hypothetical protein
MITNHSRRAALGALASVPALAILPAVALAAPVDPIFDAIGRHRAAFAIFSQAYSRTDEVLARRQCREITDDDEAAWLTSCQGESEALDEFFAIAPTTMAGMRAALAYVVEIHSDCAPETGARIAESLLKSPLFAVI